jgi:hypothetical protein
MRNIGALLLLLCAAAVQAENHFVTLGYAGDLVFSPDQLAASVGDTLEFQFVAGVSNRISINLILESLSHAINIRDPLCSHRRYISSQFSTLMFTQVYGPDFMPFLRRTDCHLLLLPSTILPLCGSIAHSSYTVKMVWSWQLTSMPM